MATTLKDLVRVYEQVEIELLELVAQAVSRESYGTAGKYKASLEQLQQLMEIATTKLGAMQRHITPHMLEAIEAEFAQAAAEAYRQAGAPVPVVVDVNAANAIATATTEKVVSQHAQILRAVADMYQQVVQTALTTAMFSGESNTDAVQRALNQFADRGITAFRDVNGRRWGIDTYTDMAVRTGRMRALMEGHMQGWRGAGVELVRVSTHAASHPWCYPFQGELLALDGQAGTRVMLSPITGKNEVVTVKATMQEAVEAGYKHINCRHSEAPYVPGAEVPVPDKPDEEENEQEYKALQRQRQIERHIRHWKKRQAVALTPQDKQLAARKVKAWQRAQRDHIKANKFLVRRYDRETLRRGKAGATPVRVVPTPPKPKPTAMPSEPTKPRRRNRHGGKGISVADILKRENITTTPPRKPKPKKAKTPTPQVTVSPADRINGYIDGATPWEAHSSSAPRRYATLSDVPKTSRTSWEQVAKEANPNFTGSYNDPYSVNCVRASHATEARLRGLDLTAGRDTYLNQAPPGGIWNAISKDCAELGLRANNSVVAVTSAWRGPNGEVRNFYKAQRAKTGVKGGANAQTLIDLNEAVPDGARGFARGRWQKKYGGGGHIWNWVKQNGKIRYFESQTHEGFVDTKKTNAMLMRGSLEVIRVDDLTPTDELLGVIGVD